MGITALFSTPFYTGQSTTTLVPGLFPVAIDGHPYMIDESIGIEIASIPVLRTQADTADRPGERSINPQDLWRRAQESWHLGAGQSVLDRDTSSPYRFRASKGVDVWTQWQLSLLPSTDAKRASANTNLRMAVAGARLYLADGTALAYTTDVSVDTPTFTAVTGTPGVSISSVTSDGFKVYIAVGASGVYRTDTSTGAAQQLVSTAVNAAAVLGYVKGRLMLGSGASLYNITQLTTNSALPTALFTHGNTNWSWVGFAEGPGDIYAAGYSGDKSLIYRTSIKADGTALDAPIVAGELPDGETVRSIQGYLGFIVLGTDKGVRFCGIDNAGNLSIGSLISTGAAVNCFEPQDRFVWFGWTNYDATSTGLGRLDLSQFTSNLTPAYATDLMADVQGAVQSVATFQNLRVFTVSGQGVYAQHTDLVASGTIESGGITYSLPDDKVALFLHLRTASLVGSVTLALSANGGTYDTLGTSSTAASTKFVAPCGEVPGERFETKLTLTRDAVATTGPTVTRVTLRAAPVPAMGTLITLPILLHSKYWNGQSCNCKEEFDYLRDLRDTANVVQLQIGAETYSVTLDDFRFRTHHRVETDEWWEGTFIAVCKQVAGSA